MRVETYASGKTVPIISFWTSFKRPVEMRFVGDKCFCLAPPGPPLRRRTVRGLLIAIRIKVQFVPPWVRLVVQSLGFRRWWQRLRHRLPRFLWCARRLLRLVRRLPLLPLGRRALISVQPPRERRRLQPRAPMHYRQIIVQLWGSGDWRQILVQ